MTGECLEELFESLIEEGIASGISWVFSNAITNALFIFISVQGLKVTTKGLCKLIFLIVKPLIKKITYKEGNDKVETIKNLIRRLKMDEEKKNKIKDGFKRFGNYLKRNVKSNTATITNLVASCGAGTLFGGGLAVGQVDLPIWAYVILGIIATVISFVLIELGVIAPGYENQNQYDVRTEKEKVEKEIKLEEKKKHDEEIANQKAKDFAEKKAKEKLLADQKAKEEEKAKAELDAKVNAIKQEYQTAVNNGEFTGTLTDWLNRK